MAGLSRREPREEASAVIAFRFFVQGLGLLMNILKESPPDSSSRVKALAALACQMRHHRPSEISFVNAGGLAVLVHAMHSHNIKVSGAKHGKDILVEKFFSCPLKGGRRLLAGERE